MQPDQSCGSCFSSSAHSSLTMSLMATRPPRRTTQLWSGCIGGAYREDAFLDAFDSAGFNGMEIVKRDEKPWRTFKNRVSLNHCRSLQRQARAMLGPQAGGNLSRSVAQGDRRLWARVGARKRMAVCDKTFQIYNREPYAQDILPVEPYETVPLEDAVAFDCNRTACAPSA